MYRTYNFYIYDMSLQSENLQVAKVKSSFVNNSFQNKNENKNRGHRKKVCFKFKMVSIIRFRENAFFREAEKKFLVTGP